MLRRFFSYYQPYKGLFALDFSCAVLAGLLELIFPLAVNYFVDTLLPGQNWSLIAGASIALLAIYMINAGLQYIVTYWGHRLGINIETDMRKSVFAHVQKQSFRFFDNTKTGQLLARMTNDLMDVGELAHHGPEDLFIAIMTLLGAFSVMLFINWKMALIIFAIIPFLIFMGLFFHRRMTTAMHQLFSNIADFNTRIEDNVGGMRVVQAFANEATEQAQFDVNNRNFRKTKLVSYKIMGMNLSISYLLMRVVTLISLVCGAYFVIIEELSSGEFIAFVLLTNVLFRPIEKINAIVESYPKGIAGFKRFCELLDTEPDIKDEPNAVDVGALHGDIRYENVTFGYEDSATILNGIDLSIRAGETVAFVGPSGAGKTTLCSLLPRFYEANEGAIHIDGTPIKHMTLASLRKNIGVVAQDVFLFSGSIRENIAYGKLDASEEEIWEAARHARLEELIQAQPDGLDTIIGERGVKLSGGQKQRLSIARMFLKNPPILILDEATSALDTETEWAIQQSLAELSKGRTTLVIAHRLATIKNADRIVVLTKDGVAEQGSHEELIEQKGLYSRLHSAQFGVIQHEALAGKV
ncbi:ABC transporter ATP-binding protein [Aureibacillus halotolerans]|uniref:ATP-binding cassette subfamily B protein n=1 Tax=Aureibacillus halotolerans TaxID=1508390 RepID=A0A4V3D4S5_9BACI|nr:ABC transporter ATP-binding protein [Aureibacillus halotolerans]TDQ37417.1 ATP-binding cassette subfamily B protein [Aureibacillus halotolerans]